MKLNDLTELIAAFLLILLSATMALAQSEKPSVRTEDLSEKAQQLAKRTIIVDGHMDLPYRLFRSRDKQGRVTVDVSQRTKKGDFDYVRAMAGGLDAPFMSIYVPARYQDHKGEAKALADNLIDLVEGLIENYPDKFAPARSVADVKANFKAGRISLPMGIENGAAIEDNIANLEHFFDRGVRYMTLAHSQTNRICDSSYDPHRQWHGLSPFGEQVVAAMNRLGIMIDVSHVSDECFARVIELSKAPIVATHSSARAFTPGWERNMNDAMIRRLAEKQGVVMINFGSGFIEKKANKQYVARREAISAFRREHKLDRRDPRLRAFRETYDREHPFEFATVEMVADHIDHVVQLVGIDYVGLGSDFEGLGDTLPKGLKDVSMYPQLFRVLLKRGYTESDIQKIASGNIFRVWQSVEDLSETGRHAGRP
jgi:membrane dipeptidase